MVGVRVMVGVEVRVGVADTAGVLVDVGGTGQVGAGALTGQDSCIKLAGEETTCAFGAACWKGSTPQPAMVNEISSQITFLIMESLP
jgi:hypothetical protein